MSERLIHLPVLLAIALAAVFLGRVASISHAGLAACLVATLILNARNLRFEISLLRAAAREPDLALARDSARAIEGSRHPGECVSVFAPAVPRSLLDAYVAKVAAGLGDVEAARERAANLTNASPDRDRIAAHLKAPVGTVRVDEGCPLQLIVDDVRPDPIGVDGTTTPTLVAQVSAGTRRARVLRIPR